MIQSILSVFKAVYTFQYLLYRLHNERPQIFFFFSILFPSSCVPSAVTQFTFDPLLLFSRVFFFIRDTASELQLLLLERDTRSGCVWGAGSSQPPCCSSCSSPQTQRGRGRAEASGGPGTNSRRTGEGFYVARQHFQSPGTWGTQFHSWLSPPPGWGAWAVTAGRGPPSSPRLTALSPQSLERSSSTARTSASPPSQRRTRGPSRPSISSWHGTASKSSAMEPSLDTRV